MLDTFPSNADHCDPCSFGELRVNNEPRIMDIEAKTVRHYVDRELRDPGKPVQPDFPGGSEVVDKRHAAASQCAHMIINKQCALYRYRREDTDAISILPKLHLV